jgi:two-component system C4-dicarboxylate transport response regulator DctD
MQLAGITVDAVGSAEEAQRRLRAGYPGIVVTDMRLPGIDGMTLLRWVVELDADLPVIMITGHGDVTLAVEPCAAAPTISCRNPSRPAISSTSSAGRWRSANSSSKSTPCAVG